MRDGADAFKCGVSRSELQDGVGLIPFGTMCVRESHSSESGFVGRANFSPLMDGGLEIASGRRHVASGQPYLSAREDGGGRERLALEDGRHAREFVGGRARPVDVPSGNLNLYLRREERRPTEVRIGRPLLRWNVQRIIQGFSNQGCRERHLTLGQTHQRKARLRIPPRLVRRQERLFRAAKISGVQANSTELGQRPSEFPSQVRAQFLTRAERFLLRLTT